MRLGMGDDSLPDLECEVEAPPPLLQSFDGPKALLRVSKAGRLQGVEELFAHVAKGRVPQVVAQGDSLGEILVQIEGARDRPRDLRHLQRMGQPSDEVVAGGRDKHLGLVLETPERHGVDDPVAVPLEFAAQGVRLLGEFAKSVARPGRVG